MISRRRVVCFGFALALAGLMLGSAAAATQQPDRFYVFGFVKNPGVYLFKADMTVGDAIDAAGGFASREISDIIIIRMVNGEKETVVVSFNDAVRANDSIAVR